MESSEEGGNNAGISVPFKPFPTLEIPSFSSETLRTLSDVNNSSVASLLAADRQLQSLTTLLAQQKEKLLEEKNAIENICKNSFNVDISTYQHTAVQQPTLAVPLLAQPFQPSQHIQAPLPQPAMSEPQQQLQNKLKIKISSNILQRLPSTEDKDKEKISSQAQSPLVSAASAEDIDDDSVNGSNMANSASARRTSTKNLSRMHQVFEQSASGSADPKKARVPNQIPVMSFWQYIDGFFKILIEEDLTCLMQCTMDSNPAVFTMPPLKKTASTSSLAAAQAEKKKQMINEDSSHHHHSMVSRLFQALVEEEIFLPKDSEFDSADDAVPCISEPESRNNVVESSFEFDERLRQEMISADLWDDVCEEESDEIAVEIKALQSQLIHQQDINNSRKKRLLSVIEDYVAHQEFYCILDELDKQIESLYIKRLKSGKKGNRKKSLGAADPYLSDVMLYLDRREKMLEYFQNNLIYPRGFYGVESKLFQDTTPPSRYEGPRPQYQVPEKQGIFNVNGESAEESANKKPKFY